MNENIVKSPEVRHKMSVMITIILVIKLKNTIEITVMSSGSCTKRDWNQHNDVCPFPVAFLPLYVANSFCSAVLKKGKVAVYGLGKELTKKIKVFLSIEALINNCKNSR